MAPFGSTRATLGALLTCLAFSTASERAHACSYVGNGTLEVGDGNDGAAPSGIGDPTVTLRRGRGPTGGCGTVSSTSCGDDMGEFTVNFRGATDADTPPESVGYRVEVIAGAAPGYSVSEFEGKVLVPFDADFDGDPGTTSLLFYWADGDTDDQEGIDFTITLTPVDADGNEGSVSDPIQIRDEGRSGGCSVGKRLSPGGFAATLLVVAGVTAVVRRRARATSRIS